MRMSKVSVKSSIVWLIWDISQVPYMNWDEGLLQILIILPEQSCIYAVSSDERTIFLTKFLVNSILRFPFGVKNAFNVALRPSIAIQLTETPSGICTTLPKHLISLCLTVSRASTDICCWI